MFKELYFLFVVLLLTACSTLEKSNPVSNNQQEMYNFDYLLGKWVRTNNKAGRKTYEHWQKTSNGDYYGLGFTLENRDTVFKENLRFVKIDGTWNYEVTGVNETPTYFKMTSQSATSFVCKNPANEFPKKIEYQLDGDTLKAKVSTGETVIPFYFKKQAATTLLSNKIDSIFHESEIPGCSMMVVNEDGVLFEEAKGFANLKTQQKYTAHTIQNIASVSKTLIGVAIMKAVEQGKLNLAEDINKYLPFQIVNPNFPDQPITIKQLATHTSSILDSENYFKSYFFYDAATITAADLTKEYQEMLPVLKENKLIDDAEFLENLLSPKGKWFSPKVYSANKPGSTFEYSNVGATLAAYVIEKASGMSYEAYTQKYIFDPLKMTETGWEKSQINQTQFAQRYFQKDKEVPDYYLISKADGGLLTNTHDYSQFFIEMIKGFNGQGQLLSKAAYTTLFSPHIEINKKRSSGIFWVMSKDGNGFMHDGSDPGVMTLVSYNKTKKIGRIFFCNLDAMEKNIAPIIQIWQALGKEDWINQK